MPSVIKILSVLSEEMSFEAIGDDGRRTTLDGRHTSNDHNSSH